ncbi:molybdopterin molybdotransferase MoeA [Laribacter hongkongensis]|uniref:Molybdopterin molybdenumtransferase n=1 Tax=Laribacter hongkongensis TaxID=168471 RepID=A0ABD4SNQ6_9NEIS|nr:gephyrin-like molybdotransferase Glp [Laribacter hongkongensis]MCG9024837.1 molybdopterin molybdotransferase MoeA [Laribacter hongkongensis]MCG9101911.1 molybdopterin molybdotransferase MoeA [Laribacter hongkongensis]MCG9102248.1 molybdopterin molybdotransferase MoeA [Laribacter hongkongensis]MCG9112282.1 molybdopterin molybdotransferase MoeA [Laribacter hongkongensis]MCG9117837.1 molybdopterin molybdotransferase MoeA [Laribacter hongkongensis]
MTTPALLPFDDARTWLLDRARRLTETEVLPLVRARGRILARDVVSRLAVPPQDNSAMDGFALRVADWAEGKTLPVSQRVPAGTQPQPLQPGTAARIFTGAPVPAGADCVVMQELCRQEGDCVLVASAPRAGQNIRRAGEDIAAGTVVVAAGSRLKPADIGLIASVGQPEVEVLRPLRVAVFFTGDELTEPGETLFPGRIYNSNRYWLRGILTQMGCEVRDLATIPDSLAATRLALADAAGSADVVMTCGGVSVGEEDHVKTAVEREGRLDLWRLAIKPGKPFAFGAIGEADFIGLPGNPVSGFVTLATLVAPFLRERMGLDGRAPMLSVQLPARFDWQHPDSKRTEFLRARLSHEEGRFAVEIYPQQGSGVLTSCAWADGLVRLAPGQSVKAGDPVDYLPLSNLISG